MKKKNLQIQKIISKLLINLNLMNLQIKKVFLSIHLYSFYFKGFLTDPEENEPIKDYLKLK